MASMRQNGCSTDCVQYVKFALVCWRLVRQCAVYCCRYGGAAGDILKWGIKSSVACEFCRCCCICCKCIWVPAVGAGLARTAQAAL